MMEFELDTKSWHFKLANFGTRRIREWRDDNDFCSYVRAVFWGFFWLTLAVTGATLLIGLTGNMVYELIVTFGTDLPLGDFAKFMLLTYIAITGIALMLFTTFLLCEKVIPAAGSAYRHVMYGRRKPDTPPSFFTLAYRKFKEKTCFKIKFKYEE